MLEDTTAGTRPRGPALLLQAYTVTAPQIDEDEGVAPECVDVAAEDEAAARRYAATIFGLPADCLKAVILV